MNHSHFKLIEHETNSNLRATVDAGVITEIEWMLDKGLDVHELEGHHATVVSKNTNEKHRGYVMKIALVIGHRKSSQGAYGSEGLSEYAFYKEFLSELPPYLSDNHSIKIFERKDKGRGYSGRMRELHQSIDAWGAKISISFHFNASSRQGVNGHEVLYCSQKGRKLALKLDKKLDQYLDNRDRKIKKRNKRQRGGGFLCRGRSVSILIEPFFASHQYLFIEGGEERDNLLSAVSEFINELD